MKINRNIGEWANAYIDAMLEKNNSTDWINGWAVWQFFELEKNEPKICLDVIIEITKKTSSSKVLGILAAGPLEDIIESNGEKVIDEIKKEAKRNSNFQYLLECMWRSGSDEVWAEIMKLRTRPDIHKDMD